MITRVFRVCVIPYLSQLMVFDDERILTSDDGKSWIVYKFFDEKDRFEKY